MYAAAPKLRGSAAEARVLELLDSVGFCPSRRTVHDYPFSFPAA